jgi:hypothetical protein
MSSLNYINISNNKLDLIDTISSITPTLPSDESLIIKALIKALNNTIFKLIYA